MKNKPIIAMDLSTSGKGGGPYTSTIRIMNSKLCEKYDFRKVYYDTELGRGVSLRRIKDLVKQMKEIQPDIVHYTGLQLSGFQMAVACKLARIKNTVMTVRGFSGDALYFHPLKKLILSLVIEPMTLLLTRVIYGNSEYTTNRKVIRIFKNKCIGAIYNFPPSQVNVCSTIRNELGISITSIVVVTVARIIKDKGYHILTEAILKLTGIKDLKFLIIGDGEYLPEMKLRLKKQVDNDQVFFLGHRDDIQQILKVCNIFVLPTLHETLSVALLEASVEGLALIASDTGGVPEIVENGYNGLLVKPGDVDQLAEAIHKLQQNRTLRIQCGINATKRVNERFANQIIESKIDNLYQSLLNDEGLTVSVKGAQE